MAVSWRQTTIGELCDQGVALIQTGPFGSQLHSYDYEPVGIPIIPTEAIGRRYIRTQGLPRISPAKAQQLARHIVHENDILFARRGAQATGLSAIVRKEQEGWLCGSGAMLLRVSSPTIDPQFLSFTLSSDSSIAWLKSRAVGAVMPNLNDAVLRGLPLMLPPFRDQRAIAAILGSLDDKIELNHRMNETLEAFARALVKSWFVDFDPVRAKAEGWRKGKVAEIASLSRASLNPSNFPNEMFEHYSIPAFDEGRLPKAETGDQIKSNKFLVTGDAILISRLNPRIPRVWFPSVSASRRSICSTEFLVASPQAGCTREYLYALFSSEVFLNEFATMVTGTSGSHQRVKAEFLTEMKAVIPSKVAIERFTKNVKPMFERIQKNIEQSQTLATLRDALLPKLMNGEMRVKDAEEVVGAAT